MSPSKPREARTWKAGDPEPADVAKVRDRCQAAAKAVESADAPADSGIGWYIRDFDEAFNADRGEWKGVPADSYLECLAEHLHRVGFRLTPAASDGETVHEWGAKWADGGYCPSSPPRSEEFARKHASAFGTRPIRRDVGPWRYADTGELAFPDAWADAGVSGTPEAPAASRDQATIGVRALIDAYAAEDPADGDYGPGFRRDRVAGEAFDALRAVAGLHDEMDRRIGRALLKAARPTPPPPRAEPGHWQWRGYDQFGQDVWSWEPPEPAGGER